MPETLAAKLISDRTKREHRATWWVYTGPMVNGQRERIRHQSTMRGFWPGYEVTCSCGWETRTGGAVRSYVAERLWQHRFDAQWEAHRA